ncbi:MAG TPA: hypothetical protein VGH73_06115 [Thermoanaerobaculia bacterium]|jgi:hypothetical protein
MDSATAQALFDAYRAGLLNREAADPRDYHPRYQVLLRHLVTNQLPLPERLLIRKVRQASSQGLRLAREGRLGEATECLAAGRRELGREKASTRGWLMAKAVLESALAYLDFREARFDQARERLQAAMEADALLEQDTAFGLLEVHRIQSVLNLLRLELRVGRLEVAGSLGGHILAYLEGLTNGGLPVHHSWHRETFQRHPRAVRLAMVTQVANEMALALSRTSSPLAWEAFREVLERGSDYFERDRLLHPRVQRWLHLKRSFERQDWELYLVLVKDFLRMGRRDVTPLWYSSVIDLLHFCRTADSGPSLQIRAGILRDSSKWRALPPSLRTCLDRDRDLPSAD